MEDLRELCVIVRLVLQYGCARLIQQHGCGIIAPGDVDSRCFTVAAVEYARDGFGMGSVPEQCLRLVSGAEPFGIAPQHLKSLRLMTHLKQASAANQFVIDRRVDPCCFRGRKLPMRTS